MISSANSGLAILIKNELDPLPSRFRALDDGSSSFPDLVCGKLNLGVLVLPFKLIVRVLGALTNWKDGEVTRSRKVSFSNEQNEQK
jgi:hypothetical protein